MAPRQTKQKGGSCMVKNTAFDIPAEEFDDVRLISARTVRELLDGISDMQLWRMVHNPALEFPQPIKLAVPAGKKPRIVSTRNFFRFRDVKAWIAKREALSVERTS
jgi:predicted DNA-binding transcriptional regulator AlpA